jgi:hypothetical protein
MGYGGTRQGQIIRGGKIAQLDDPGEQAHGFEAIPAYCHLLNSDTHH